MLLCWLSGRLLALLSITSSCHANACSAAATPLKPVVKLQAGEKPAYSEV